MNSAAQLRKELKICKTAFKTQKIIVEILTLHRDSLHTNAAAGWAWAEKLSLHLYELVEIESDAAATLRNYESAKDARYAVKEQT